MASNFAIFVDKNSDCFGLYLTKVFDAPSAYELIYPIKKWPDDNLRIFIHPEGLKNISLFGVGYFFHEYEYY